MVVVLPQTLHVGVVPKQAPLNFHPCSMVGLSQVVLKDIGEGGVGEVGGVDSEA